jgi:hypothetical protein
VFVFAAEIASRKEHFPSFAVLSAKVVTVMVLPTAESAAPGPMN